MIIQSWSFRMNISEFSFKNNSYTLLNLLRILRSSDFGIITRCSFSPPICTGYYIYHVGSQRACKDMVGKIRWSCWMRVSAWKTNFPCNQRGTTTGIIISVCGKNIYCNEMIICSHGHDWPHSISSLTQWGGTMGSCSQVLFEEKRTTFWNDLPLWENIWILDRSILFTVNNLINETRDWTKMLWQSILWKLFCSINIWIFFREKINILLIYRVVYISL